MTGFVDWNEFARLNEASQQEALQKQMSDLQAQSQNASHLLNQAKWDAQQRQLTDPNAQISSVGSYADYLRVKDNMRNSLQKMMAGESGDFQALREQILKGGMGNEAQKMLTEIQGKETAVTGQVMESGAGAAKMQAEAKARADKAAADAADKAKADEELKRQFYAGVQGKWAGSNAFEPFGRPGEHRQDQTQLARMLAVGREGGYWLPQSNVQNQTVNAQAWGGAPDSSLPKTPKRDAYGRRVDAQGNPIYGWGT